MWELIRANQRRTFVLFVGMAALLLGIGYALGTMLSPDAWFVGPALAFCLWAGLSLVSFFAGDRIVLATAGARKIRKEDHPILWNVVEEMCIASGLSPMPAVYIIDQSAPNAFATGRSPETASVAVTAGLLETLDRDELQGVVAHEIGHIKNRDVLYMTVAGIMMGSIVMLADIGIRMHWFGGRRRTSSDNNKAEAIMMLVSVVVMILAPILAQLMYFALSRKREYLADASSAVYTRYPEGLARALEKISASDTALPTANRATAPMFIINPLALGAHRQAALSSTHPPTEERVRILRSLAGQSSFRDYDQAFRKVTHRAVGVVPAGALAAIPAGAAAVREAIPDSRSHLDRVRQSTDALWRLQNYAFLTCACGTSLKVPPEHQGRPIRCPHCGAEI